MYQAIRRRHGGGVPPGIIRFTYHDPDVVESDGQAGAGDKIEVTPEMIDAGVHAMFAYENDEMWASAEERVLRIFEAMFRAKSGGVGEAKIR